ncbi:MAG: GPR endopeptidase [Acholeplasmatales bacterium]|nr:GPR endopeptidase [Acholeplasmatales bacterium]
MKKTDLLCEEAGLDSSLVKNTKYETVDLSKVVLDEANAKRLKRDAGIYYTLLSDAIVDINKKKYDDLIEAFSKVIREYLALYEIKKDDLIFVVGLGNEEVTPDSLGPKVVQMIDVTSHLFRMNFEHDNMQNVVALAPGVMSQTGLETVDVIKSISSKIHPKLVIVIDALASISLKRLNHTIQINNASISPGAGIGNFRKKFSQKTLGCPLLAIGVPTVVDIKAIFEEALKNVDLNFEDLMPFVAEDDKIQFMVTPKEIDMNINDLANIIARGLNKAFHNLNYY